MNLSKFDLTKIIDKPPLVLAVFFMVGFALYGNILNAPFQFDDHYLMLENPAVRNVAHLLTVNEGFDQKRKFITFFTFVLNYKLGGENPLGYHLVNVAVHSVTAFLLYLVLGYLFETPVMQRSPLAREKNLFRLLVCLIFLAHPLQTQAVTYIWQRAESLSGLFYLWAYLLYFTGRMRKKIVYYYAAVIIFYAGFFVKGTIVTLPLLILVTEVVFFEHSRKVKQRLLAGFLGSLSILLALWSMQVLAVLLKKINLGFMLIHKFPQVNYEYVLTQFRVVLKYIQLSFLPFGQNVDYYFRWSKTFFELDTFLSFLALAGILVYAVYSLRRHALQGFGILWFFIYLIPTS